MAKIQCWIGTSLDRVFPQSSPPAPAAAPGAAPGPVPGPVPGAVPGAGAPTLVLRGEVYSFQIGLRPEERTNVTVAFAGSLACACQTRQVGLVPAFHPTDMPDEVTETRVPGLVPDILRPGESFDLDPGYAQALWITVRLPRDIEPGDHDLAVTVSAGDEAVWKQTICFRILPIEQPPIPQMPVSHWFYCDSILEWYRLEPWEEGFWTLAEAYLRNVTDHGQNMVLTPTITPSVDAEKRPHQLVAITEPEPGRFAFDFADLDRWIRLCLKCGVQYFEIAHLATQWGADRAPAIFVDDGRRLFDRAHPSVSPEYRNFLAQYLPALVGFLESKGVMDRCYFHISDEPPLRALDNYRAMRQMLREFAPGARTLDALSDFEFIQEGAVDFPVPHLHAAPGIRAKTDGPVWTYFCCGPKGRFVNRALDSPLYKFRLLGWLIHRLRLDGFLHWSYNHWFTFRSQGPSNPLADGTGPLLDPFLHTDGLAYPTLPSGECFLVYPGQAGPLDSIRWETFRESMQDHALLRLAEDTLGPIDLPDLVDFETYPASANWLLDKRQAILTSLATTPNQPGGCR